MLDFFLMMVTVSALVVIFGLVWALGRMLTKKPAAIGLKTSGAGLLLFIAAVIGAETVEQKVEMDESVVLYEDLQSMIEEQEGILEGVEGEVTAAEKTKSERDGEISEKEEKIASLDEEIRTKQAEVDEINALIDDKESITDELAELKSQLDAKKKEKEGLDGQVASKKEELASIDTSIQEKSSAPVELSAGQYTIGADFPAGRYKAVPAGEGSNFVVYDSSGSLSVNTILGNDSTIGVPEYIFHAEEGGTVESRAPVRLVPVE